MERSLEDLWTTAGTLTPAKEARRYWEAVDDSVVSITNTSYDNLRQHKQQSVDATGEVGREGVMYWESVKQDYHRLSRKTAISKLIKAEKIDQKMDVILKSTSELGQMYHV